MLFLMIMKKIGNYEIDAYNEFSKLKKRFVFDSKSKKIKTKKNQKKFQRYSKLKSKKKTIEY